MNKKGKKPRQVKLQPRYRELVYGQKIVPELKLSGVWLGDLGFKAGDQVRITTREKLLIIEPLKD
jgi:toxic protein SymE